MSDKKQPDYWLRQVLFQIMYDRVTHPTYIKDEAISTIKAAIAKDREEERLLFKKMEGGLEENNLKNISTNE